MITCEIRRVAAMRVAAPDLRLTPANAGFMLWCDEAHGTVEVLPAN